MILQLNLNIQKEFIKNKRDAELVIEGSFHQERYFFIYIYGEFEYGKEGKLY